MLLKEAIFASICPCCQKPLDLYLNWLSTKQNKSILSEDNIIFFMRFTDKDRKSINTYSFRIDLATHVLSIKNLEKPEFISLSDLTERMKGITFNLFGFCDKCEINAKIGSLGYNHFQLFLKEYLPEYRWNLSYSNEEFQIIKNKDEVVISLLEESFGPLPNSIFKLPPETTLIEAKAILDKFAGFL